MDRLDVCIRTRKLAASCLAETLRVVLERTEPVSEQEMCAMWLAALRRHSDIFPDGWYAPPPHGMFVQFGTATDPGRVNQTNNRVPKAWPRTDIFLDRDVGILSAYASPVDRQTGMIGDFGILLYFGRNEAVAELFRRTLTIDAQVFEQLEVGMTFAEVANQTLTGIARAGMANTIASTSDSAGTNIGHTLPAADTGWSEAEKSVIAGADWEKAAALISSRRQFLNILEETTITPTMAHTLEPRPGVPGRLDLPMVNLHTAVIWRDGKKQHLTDFDELFELAGMDVRV
jgi:hypothetical protein